MSVTPDLIHQFFLRKCTPAEADRVADYLNGDPAAADNYLGKAEWDEEIGNVDQPAAFWAEVWSEIRPREQKRRSGWLYLKYAAAILLLAAAGWMLMPTQRSTAPKELEQPTASAFKHRVIHNTGLRVREVALADGSVVLLEPGGRIEYDQAFDRDRNVWLEGRATFRVTKDKTRPFTVQTSHLETIVLGTTFKVVSEPGRDAVTVRLYEGKVKVRPAETGSKRAQVYFLVAGDQLVYHKSTGSGRVTRADTRRREGAGSRKLVFDKEPLSAVFDELAFRYNVQIQYTNSDFTNMYYIGSFDETDSIQHILANIAKLNDLMLTKTEAGGYELSKKRP
ncbi:hypothetical protein C7T94_14585 [Pedobacter yulinensis]|uniref:FecR protein domain-containing protein n=1 Tax=Pedobacter yulinensis TaxID=2126353 RepID=A0A2T3HHY6_9SPHI|nr:FecR family protein [Pedobacter yulinensis]PST82040.1 hypothetical protein C7T94_14585 [Pedobacter yulinensis]